jgi:cytochrome c2
VKKTPSGQDAKKNAFAFFAPWRGIFDPALVMLLLALPAVAQEGDARRGAQLLQDRRCTVCHSINGVGGGLAPDLARLTTRDFTPAGLAALMWNHGPAMWRAMAARSIEVPSLRPGEVADLFAYFYSERYFDPAGDAARGRRVFTERRCETCHALTPSEAAKVGTPVAKWPSTSDPVQWAQQMWNHAGPMLREMEKARIPWPELTVQELADLIVFVQSLPQRPAEPPALVFGNAARGEKLFEQGCTRCHSLGMRAPGRIDLLRRSDAARTMTGLAVEMWNHGPRMRRRAAETRSDLLPFEGAEMNDLVAYLWTRRYFEESGHARRGRRIYNAKRCQVCHEDRASGAPALTGEFAAPVLASALWQHGPAMLAQMEKRSIRWPVFTGREMADLIAYLNAR